MFKTEYITGSTFIEYQVQCSKRSKLQVAHLLSTEYNYQNHKVIKINILMKKKGN